MPFDLQPCLQGDLLELRPLRAADFRDLYAVAADPLIWEQHPCIDRYQEEVFKVFFREALDSRSALIAIDRADRRVVGNEGWSRRGTRTRPRWSTNDRSTRVGALVSSTWMTQTAKRCVSHRASSYRRYRRATPNRSTASDVKPRSPLARAAQGRLFCWEFSLHALGNRLYKSPSGRVGRGANGIRS